MELLVLLSARDAKKVRLERRLLKLFGTLRSERAHRTFCFHPLMPPTLQEQYRHPHDQQVLEQRTLERARRAPAARISRPSPLGQLEFEVPPITSGDGSCAS